jgi:biotin carboxyl carrier protein
MIYEVTVTGSSQTYRVELKTNGSGGFECSVNGQAVALDAIANQPGVLSLLIEGHSYEVHRTTTAQGMQISINGEDFPVEVRDPRSLRARKRAGAGTEGPKKITASMPGKVVRVLAPEGTHVEAGQGVVVIEAMKMQNELKSPKAGVVKKINAAEGATVNAGDPLAVIE